MSSSRRPRTWSRAELGVLALVCSFTQSGPEPTSDALDRLGVRRLGLPRERARAGITLELVRHLVDQLLHLAEELRGRLTGLGLLAAQPLVLGLQLGHRPVQSLALLLHGLCEAPALLDLRAQIGGVRVEPGELLAGFGELVPDPGRLFPQRPRFSLSCLREAPVAVGLFGEERDLLDHPLHVIDPLAKRMTGAEACGGVCRVAHLILSSRREVITGNPILSRRGLALQRK